MSKREPIYSIYGAVPQAIEEFMPSNELEIVAREILLAVSEPCRPFACRIMTKDNVTTLTLSEANQEIRMHVKPGDIALFMYSGNDYATLINERVDFQLCDQNFFESMVACILEFLQRTRD